MRRHALFRLACVFAALAAGCAVGPDFRPPAAPEAARYTREPLTSTASAEAHAGDAQRFVVGGALRHDWWTLFGSAAIDDLVARALARNPNIDSAQAALRQARSLTAAQRSAFFPALQGSWDATRQSNPVGTISPTLTSGEPVYTLHTAQLNVSYAADVFGSNRRTVESLAAQEQVQRAQLDATYLTLVANVVAAAIQDAALRAQLDAAEAALAAQTRSLALVRRQADAGWASGLDVAAQESALAQAQAALPGLHKQIEQNQNQLAALLGALPGEEPTHALRLDDLALPAELPLALPSALVRRRPDLRAAEAQVHAASAQVGVAAASRLPQFSISAVYGGTATRFGRMFSDGNAFWSFGANLATTLFDFGALAHREHAAQAGLDQAVAQYRTAVITAFQNVADALYALRSDAQALAAAVAAEKAALRSAELTRHQFEAGAVNALALLYAEQTRQQARGARIQAQAARLADTVALFQALGGSWPAASADAGR